MCANAYEGFKDQEGLPIGEYVHLNRLDRFRFPMNHAPNSLGCVAAEHWFAAMEADRRRNLLNPHGLALDIKDLGKQFLTALGLPAHMTAKHGYLRLA
jgi:hypothetical protein